MTVMAPLVRMNGIGNRILIIDMRAFKEKLKKTAVLALAKHTDTEFDQIMVIYPPRRPSTADALLEIWNSDGSRARACGNGTRCVVAWLANEAVNGKNQPFHFETQAGMLHAISLGAGQVRVDMGRPSFSWKDIPTTRPLDDTLHVDITAGPLRDGALVSMGNPHCIFFVKQDVNRIDLARYGMVLECHPLFADKANISLAWLDSTKTMQLRTWERGAGLTLACGSAACAATAAAVCRGLCERQVTVRLPGGNLQVEWLPDEEGGHVMMSGATQHEWTGEVDTLTGHFRISL